MRISFFGAARTVTGSCYMLEHEDSKFLVDCGLFQGNKLLKERNYGEFPFNPSDIDFVILTHAHVDHSGLLPKLHHKGFSNPIYTTSATVSLAEIMLPDCGYIQEMEVERKNRKLARQGKPLLIPIYTANQARETQKLFVAKNYDEEFSPASGITIIMRDAGHILGAAMVEIIYTENGQEKKMVFTGDLGRKNQSIVRNPHRYGSMDYLIMESTYGNRLHTGVMVQELPAMADIITNTFARGGNVVIPAFAVNRTQDLLMMLYILQQRKMIPDCQVYLDSPLAINATEIFAKEHEYYDQLTRYLFEEEGKAPFILDNLQYIRTVEESMSLNKIKGRAIIISASGMADAGRIKHHLKHNLWRKESSVIFCGYQAEGTLGRRLVDGETKVTIHGEQVEVKADINNLDGFSSHADRNELLEWILFFDAMPSKIFVTHGEESASLAFAELVQQKFRANTIVPNIGDSADLSRDDTTLKNMDVGHNLNNDKLLADIEAALRHVAAVGDEETLLRARDMLHNFM